jgi:transposase InsO family protein
MFAGYGNFTLGRVNRHPLNVRPTRKRNYHCDLQGSLSIERMCQLAQVSRAGFYRSPQERLRVEEEMEVRSSIQQIVLEHRRRYGYRRVTAELRRRGLVVNHKRVARLMREDNLLAVQPRAFVVTTDS